MQVAMHYCPETPALTVSKALGHPPPSRRDIASFDLTTSNNNATDYSMQTFLSASIAGLYYLSSLNLMDSFLAVLGRGGRGGRGGVTYT